MPSYRDQIHPWCIVRILPNAQTLIIARFRRRNDADAHLKVLQQLISTAEFRIVFDGLVQRGDRPPFPNPNT
jgi:hypothetical protein